MALIVPSECRETPKVWAWLQELIAGNGPIRHVEVLTLRESMRNGGGPACLRLRVVVDEAAHAAIDPRFLLDPARCDLLAALVERRWPEHITPEDLGNPALWQQCRTARAALLDALGFAPGEV
jgi:succinylarginine dihydrolase